MGYTPKKVKVKSGYGPRGIAKIQINKKLGKARVTFKDKKFDTGSNEIDLNLNECPDNVRPGIYIVSMSANGSTMYSIAPVEGAFVGKVDHFAAKEGEKPAPKTHDKYHYQYWTVVLKITQGDEKGMEVPFTLRYWFMPVEEEIKGKTYTTVGIEVHDSKYYIPLVDFLKVTGVWEQGPIQYTDNILPTLEKRMLDADKEFGFLVKEGFVREIIKTHSDEEF